jgi:hypothetical protein
VMPLRSCGPGAQDRSLTRHAAEVERWQPASGSGPPGSPMAGRRVGPVQDVIARPRREQQRRLQGQPFVDGRSGAGRTHAPWISGRLSGSPTEDVTG